MSLRRAGRACAVALGLALLGAAAPTVAAGPAGSAVDWSGLTWADGSRLDADRLTGRPVIVVFWATWCGFCERHNARVDRLHRSLQGQSPQVVGVAIDGSAASVGRFVRERGWAFPVAVDGGALRRQFTTRRMVPMTCLVTASGSIRQCIPGEMAEDDVMALARPAPP